MSEIKNGDKCAYPLPDAVMDEDYKHGTIDGLTKREYFAGLAMQGLLSGNRLLMSNAAVEAVKIADSLLAELEKGND